MYVRVDEEDHRIYIGHVLQFEKGIYTQVVGVDREENEIHLACYRQGEKVERFPESLDDPIYGKLIGIYRYRETLGVWATLWTRDDGWKR